MHFSGIMNDSPEAASTERVVFREFAVHAAILVVILAILFPATFLRGELISPEGHFFKDDPWRRHMPDGAEIPANDQTFEFVSGWNPFYVFGRRAMDEGQWPLWNPYYLMGIPLLGNFQSAFFYPPRMAHALFENHVGTTILMLIRLWMCGFVAYVCGRLLGLARGPSRFWSLGWMLCGYVMHWAMWTIPDVAAWFPVLFVGIELVLSGRYRRGFFTTLVGGVLVIIAGHPESAFGFCLGLGAYFLLRLVADRSSMKHIFVSVVVLSIAWAVVLLVCCAQILPFLEFLVRSHTFAYRSEGGNVERFVPIFPGLATVAFWVPRFFGASPDSNLWLLTRESPYNLGQTVPLNSNFIGLVYPGIAVWLGLGLLVACVRTDSLARRRLLCMAVPAVIGVILALNLPATAFVDRLPLVNSMHRLYHLCFFLFAVPFLGALGLDRWLRGREPRRALKWPLIIVGVMAAHVSVLLLFYWPTISFEGVHVYVLTQVGLAALFTGAGLAALLMHIRRPRARLTAGLLTVLLALDLLVAARGVNSTAPREHLDVRTDLMDYMASLGPGSRFDVALANIMLGPQAKQGIQIAGTYDALAPERYSRFLYTCYAENWDSIGPASSVTHYVVREGAMGDGNDELRLEARLEGFDIVRIANALPRVRLVPRLEVLPNREALFERLCDPSINPAEIAVTSEPPAEIPSLTSEGSPGSASIARHTPCEVDVDVQAEGNAVLVFADEYYPGWKVYVNDEPAELFPVYYAFRGVCVGKGNHRVRFSYEPASFRVGMTVSTGTLFVGALAAAVVLMRRKSRLAT
ncbi:MAG: YfhO family protein [bacterium]|nr:YfhO family protein [bacterium]